MSHVTVRFDTDNAAFRQDDESLDRHEVRTVLEVAAARIWRGTDSGSLYDANGNRVGTFIVSEDSDV
jgi:hypothetical protein